MGKRVGKEKNGRLVGDILSARYDLLKLASEHGLKPAELAEWIHEPENQRVLAGLCLLADYQTQVLLSRYRSLAATRLIKLATQEPEGDTEQGHKDADLARRACVDLLRLNLARTESGAMSEEDEEEQAGSLRQMLYGKLKSGGEPEEGEAEEM